MTYLELLKRYDNTIVAETKRLKAAYSKLLRESKEDVEEAEEKKAFSKWVEEFFRNHKLTNKERKDLLDEIKKTGDDLMTKYDFEDFVFQMRECNEAEEKCPDCGKSPCECESKEEVVETGNGTNGETLDHEIDAKLFFESDDEDETPDDDEEDEEVDVDADVEDDGEETAVEVDDEEDEEGEESPKKTDEAFVEEDDDKEVNEDAAPTGKTMSAAEWLRSVGEGEEKKDDGEEPAATAPEKTDEASFKFSSLKDLFAEDEAQDDSETKKAETDESNDNEELKKFFAEDEDEAAPADDTAEDPANNGDDVKEAEEEKKPVEEDEGGVELQKAKKFFAKVKKNDDEEQDGEGGEAVEEGETAEEPVKKDECDEAAGDDADGKAPTMTDESVAQFVKKNKRLFKGA